MFRRILLLTLGTLLVTQPAYSQNWMQRYLRERKAREDAKKAAQDGTQYLPPEPEVRRAEPVNTPAPDAPTAEVPVTPIAPGETPVPVRKAELADPVEPSTQLRRAEPAVPAVNFDSLPVRRAEPVEAAPSPTPEPTPTPKPKATPRPVAPPVVIVSTPAPTPTIKVAQTPEPPAPTPSPIVSGTAPAPESSDELDPKTNVIRIAPANKPTPPDISQFNYANAYYTRKEFDRAAAEYERYLTFYPNGIDRQAALFRMAESNRQVQNFNAARKAYETLLTEFMDGDFIGPASFRMADICFQDKNYLDALAYYRKASVRVKDPAIALSARYYAARCLESIKALSEAIDAYQDVLNVTENNPFREASRFAIARMLGDSGRRTEALTQFDTLIKETAKDSLKAEATVRQGLLLLDMGKADKAIETLKRALKMPELGEWSQIAEISLFRALYSSQNYQQVLDAYQASAKQFAPESQPEVLLMVANSNRQLDKDAAARALYEQILRDYPASIYAKESQYYRLLSLYNANAPDLLTEVDAFLAQNPEANDKHDQLILLKAEYLYKAKQYAAAAPLYASLEESRLTSTLKAEALFKRGWCYTQMQPRDNPNVIQSFSAFIDRFPVHKLAPTALAQRALSYQQSKNFKAALGDFDHILSRYPKASKERALAFEQKALIQGQQDDKQGMADTFARFLNEFPNNPSAGKANYWIGWAAFDAKKYKSAIPPLEAARKLDKEHFGDKSARLLLQAAYLQEDRKATAAEVDRADDTKTKVSVDILRWLGVEYLKANDAYHAEKYLAKLTSRDGTEELQNDDWLFLGRARIQQSKWAEAETALKTYLSKVSEPAPKAHGYLALGEAQLGARRFDDAQKSADSALAVQPEGRLNALGRMLSGDIATARAEYAEAAKLYMSVSVVFGDDAEITPKALEKAFKAYKKAGNAPQAAKTLNELQSHFPEYPVPTGN